MNKINTKWLLLPVSLLSIAASSCALAENRPGAFTIGVGEGYYLFAQKRHIENAGTPSVRLGYDFSYRTGAFVGLDIINTNQSGTQNTVRGYLYTLDGIYRFAQKGRFEPYVLGGLGVTSIKPPTGFGTVNNASANVGIGAQFFVDKMIALGADVRDVYTFSGGVNDTIVTAGITFVLGGSIPEYGIWKPVVK